MKLILSYVNSKKQEDTELGRLMHDQYPEECKLTEYTIKETQKGVLRTARRYAQ